MKYCEEFAALLDPYVDGELTGEEAARVRAHLETCPACRDYVDGALVLRAAFPDVEETEVPEGFAAGVMAAVQELAAKEKRLPSTRRRDARWKAVLLPLAACFALVVLVRTVSGGGGEQAAVSTASMAPPAAVDTAGPAGQYAFDCAPQMTENDSAASEEAAEVPVPESLAPAEAPAAGDASAPADTPAAVDSAPPKLGNGYMAAAAPAAGGKASRMAAPRAVRLTAAQAGELLADLPYTAGEDGTRCYQLPSGDFDALLTALAERDIVPPQEAAEMEGLPEGYDLVYVTEE